MRIVRHLLRIVLAARPATRELIGAAEQRALAAQGITASLPKKCRAAAGVSPCALEGNRNDPALRPRSLRRQQRSGHHDGNGSQSRVGRAVVGFRQRRRLGPRRRVRCRYDRRQCSREPDRRHRQRRDGGAAGVQLALLHRDFGCPADRRDRVRFFCLRKTPNIRSTHHRSTLSLPRGAPAYWPRSPSSLVSRTADKSIGENEQPAAELVTALMRIVEHDDHLVTRIEQAVDDVSRGRHRDVERHGQVFQSGARLRLHRARSRRQRHLRACYLRRDSPATLEQGEAVEYAEDTDRSGRPRAINVRRIG